MKQNPVTRISSHRFILLALGVLMIVTSPQVGRSDELRGILRNNLGVKSARDKKSLESYNRLNSALAEIPFSPEVHYNLGNSFLDSKDPEKALSEFREALRYTDDRTPHDRQLRFFALFNSGVALTEQKKTDEALAMYQAALEYNPDSVETKTNIELLVQQQGGGGGGGDDKDQKNKDDKNQKPKPDQDKKDQKPQDKDQKQEAPKPKPKPDLDPQSVNRILEELKRQENSIREKMQKEGPKDAPRDKDW